MSDSALYILDTSALIQAAKTYYAFDIAPTFWPHLVRLADEGNVISIDRVKSEIIRGKDDLSAWVESDFSAAFALTVNDQDVLNRYQAMIVWSQSHSEYTQAAKSEFAGADIADPWVMAYAQAKGGVVVSAEVFKKDIKRKIPIPNACGELRIQHTTIYEMLRALRVRL